MSGILRWTSLRNKKKQGAEKLKNQGTLRERMIRVAKRINWLPEFGLKRELDWLKNMHDWLISKKNRYWGLSLPIWECGGCGNFEVIGSKEELKEKAAEGWEKFSGHSPHKPYIDFVKIRCRKCGKLATRIEPVGNPWLDAGIVAFSTISKDNKGKPLYLTDRRQWEKWYPADFITESFPGQFKNWFYSLIAMSTVLEDREPMKTVLGFATLLAEDGRPMHKSWGNAIEFNEGAEKIGVDVMRWMYVKQNPADNLLFGYKIADETRRSFHLMLWNVYNFFVTYANLDNWKPKSSLPKKFNNPLDIWICARLYDAIAGVEFSLKNYDPRSCANMIEEFVNDLSLWYIRRSRERVGVSVKDGPDKDDFYITCHLVLTNLAKVLAPFTPFMAEMIYSNLSKKESVHLSDWPDSDFLNRLNSLTGGEKNREEIIKRMRMVRDIVEKAHASRKEKNIPVKQPLSLITVFTNEKYDEKLSKLIEEELNVKKAAWKKAKKPKVVLDTRITPELEEEAKTRELVRMIQNERKTMGINITQEIIVKNDWFPENKKLLELLKNKTLSVSLKKGEFEVKVA